MARSKLDFSNTEIAFHARSNTELLRAFTLFKTIHFPKLVKFGSVLMQTGFKMGLPLSPLVKWTIFSQFCGGESLEDCRPLIAQMGKDQVQAILDYGAEGEKTEVGFEAATHEILKTAREAGRSVHIPFVVFKFTGIARFELLEKLSSRIQSPAQSVSSKLTQEEEDEWARVVLRIERICDEAFKNERPVMIDAEETWIQPAIDSEAERQMQKRNKDKAWVFTTMQMYRVDRLSYLKSLTERAAKEGWQLGVKLVRGAYMEKERDHAAKQGVPSPIHKDKEATDKAYNEAIQYCFEHLDRIAVCAGTHNEFSTHFAAEKALELLKTSSDKKSRIWFSQLYGMSDHLTYNLATAGLNAAKYVPYGPIKAVVPYLIRRAEENTSVAGQSSRELQLIQQEMKRRNL